MLESLTKEELIETIHKEFAKVTRKNGVSWLEADALDGGGQQYLYDLAKQHDTERRWQDLIDSPKWNIFEHCSNLSFLDPIGFRYYLAAAMIRDLNAAENVLGDFHFWFSAVEKFSEFTQKQKLAVSAFVDYKLEYDRRRNYPDMIGKPALGTEPFSVNSYIEDSGWSDAKLFWEKYLNHNS